MDSLCTNSMKSERQLNETGELGIFSTRSRLVELLNE